MVALLIRFALLIIVSFAVVYGLNKWIKKEMRKEDVSVAKNEMEAELKAAQNIDLKDVPKFKKAKDKINKFTGGINEDV